MKEMTFRVPDSMVTLLEEWVKHIPEMELVCQKESGETDLDEMNRRMTVAFNVLRHRIVRNYFAVACMRYDSQYTLDIQITDEAMDVLLPKLTLQPLVFVEAV